MNANVVTKADTTCITTEVIDNVYDLPRIGCTGTLISPYGVCEAPFTAPVTSQPTARPTKSPTSSPTVGISSSPTKSPTKSPTMAPTKAPSPNEDGVCRDTDTKFTLQNGAMKHCQWVSWNRDARCSERTLDNKLIADICPVTCPDPVTEEPVCTPGDNTASFLVNGTSRTCAWANHDNEDTKGDRCGNFVVLANCPVTCEEYI